MTAPNQNPLCEDCKRHVNSHREASLPDGPVTWVGCDCDAPDVVHDAWEAAGNRPLPRLGLLEVGDEAYTEPPASVKRAIDEAVRVSDIVEKIHDAALAGELGSALDSLTTEEYALVEAALPPEYQRREGVGHE